MKMPLSILHFFMLCYYLTFLNFTQNLSNIWTIFVKLNLGYLIFPAFKIEAVSCRPNAFLALKINRSCISYDLIHMMSSSGHNAKIFLKNPLIIQTKQAFLTFLSQVPEWKDLKTPFSGLRSD